MGHIIMLSSSFAKSISEEAGVRSGFALTTDDILAHLPTQSPMRTSIAGEDRIVRVSSEDYADAVGDMLYALGAADQPGMPTVAQRFTKKMDRDWRLIMTLDQLLEIEAIAHHYMRLRMDTGVFRSSDFEAEIGGMVGTQSQFFMSPLLHAMSIYLAQSPFYTRTAEKIDAVALRNLFESEHLPIEDGEFFDQRFVNYLAARPEMLEEINWRQFEGLTAEWFSRAGYNVELGPGRNDGSVDMRLWISEAKPSAPCAVIVQCKREKRKVGRVVVKALYADLLHEKADEGLIVTTSDISPGAAHDCSARAYPITTANRKEVEKWIGDMRKPVKGVEL